MNDAVVVSAVRTPVGKAPHGRLSTTRPDELAAVTIAEALRRAPGIEPTEIDDVILGCAMPEAEQGLNVARIASLRAGIPVESAAVTINRFCSSGLQAIAFAAERIAFAIATYERTLVADEAPWDRFTEGDTTAMTQSQIQGWNFFRGSPCSTCHAPPTFTDHSFRNIGLRPSTEDPGRQDVTGRVQDRGRFKVPTLRNSGLKVNHMLQLPMQGGIGIELTPAREQGRLARLLMEQPKALQGRRGATIALQG